ncbi:LOW QUALITY PROTEIN: uncharacterized protein LOC116101382 [Mastomys coucha]|uniref:LOW QUALITY PROTEIN: uncharacterized protein LOC116101382 n=1 Tax=Mastomys coucha TaxID=35658 RepID=UPI0012624CE5|nr:LOW QUALITY PROTEIN: uncharacterized protein LOC116101382 [Mastomys coucha]
MTTPATCKPDCLRWGPPPLAKQEWGVEVDRGGGGGEIRRPDGARPRRRRPARELAAARWRTASTRGRQPGWRRWRAERGRAWARRRGRPEGGAGGRPGLTQLRRRAGELRAPTPGSYSRATPRLGARSGPAGLTPAPMGVLRALAPPRDRPRNSSHGGNAGLGPRARGLPKKKQGGKRSSNQTCKPELTDVLLSETIVSFTKSKSLLNQCTLFPSPDLRTSRPLRGHSWRKPLHPGLTSQPDHQSPRSRSTLPSPSPRPVGLEAPSRRSALPFPLPGRPGAFPYCRVVCRVHTKWRAFRSAQLKGARPPREKPAARSRATPAVLRTSCEVAGAPQWKSWSTRERATGSSPQGRRSGPLAQEDRRRAGERLKWELLKWTLLERCSEEAAESHPGDALLDFARVPSMVSLKPVLDSCRRGHTQLGSGLVHHIGAPHQEEPSNALCQSASLGRSHYLDHQHEDHTTKLINTTHTKNSFLIWDPAFPPGAV